MKQLCLRKEEEDVDMSKAERSVFYEGGEWVRGRLLGKGSFGSVHVAFFPDPKTDKFRGMPGVAAVKSAPLLSPGQLSQEKDNLERFQGSPNIIRYLGDDITYSDQGHLVLNVFIELASGGTLFDLVESSNGSGLTEEWAGPIAKSVLEALRRIHEDGFAHRDLKLENVLLVEEPGSDNIIVAKLADFGSAQSADRGGPMGGTEIYLSPEAVRGGVQGSAADVWALGWVVFGMLTGKLPWDDRGDLAIEEMRRVIGAESPEVPHGAVSDAAEDFLSKCFRRDPRKRPTAAALLGHPFVGGAGGDFGDSSSDEDRNNDDDDDRIGIMSFGSDDMRFGSESSSQYSLLAFAIVSLIIYFSLL